MTTETEHSYGPLDMHGQPINNASNLPVSRADLFANRGAAASYSGQYFLATDDPNPTVGTNQLNPGTLYWSDGTTWKLIASTKNELYRLDVTSTSSTTSGTASTDITGITMQLTLTTPRAVELILRGPMQNTAADLIEAQIFDADASAIVGVHLFAAAAVTAAVDNRCDISVVLDLSAAVHNYKVRLRCISTGVGKFTPTNSNKLQFRAALA